MIMARFLHRFFSELRRKSNVWILAVCFFAGLVLGIRASHEAGLSFPLMRGALKSTVSIVRLLSILLLPFLFSALAVYFSKPKLLYGIAFLKAFVFAFISAGISAGFGGAGWLIRWLLMFSDSLCLPVLLLYWLRHIPGRRRFQTADTMILAGCIGLVGLLDHRLIMPLLQGI